MDHKNEPPSTTTSIKISRRKSLIGTFIALISLALVGWLAWHLTHQAPNSASSGAPGAGPGMGAGGPGSRRGAPATTVGVAKVERTDIPVTVEALGTVTASATTTVRPQVSGVLKEVLFTEGQTVRAGQILAMIDPRQFEFALQQATGQRQRDEAQLETAKVTLERYKTLLSQDSIAQQDVDTQASLVKQLQGTVAIDRAAEGTAKLNLSYTKVVAPISGRVGLRTVDPGNVVGTNDTNGLALITQVSPIDVQFSLPQDLVPQLRVRLNDGAKLPVEALDRRRENILDKGQFLALDNQVDTQTGTVKAKARFPNTKFSLFPSQFVNVRLLLRTIEGTLVIPIAALRHGSNGDFVYVLNPTDRTVSLRTVKSGQNMEDKVEITTGLQAGEHVITEGADRLKDGAKVTLPGDKPSNGMGGRDGKSGKGGKEGGRKQGRRNSEGDSTTQNSPATQQPQTTDTAPDANAQRTHGGERKQRNSEAATQ